MNDINDLEQCPVCDDIFPIDNGYTWTADGLTCSLECHIKYYPTLSEGKGNDTDNPR